MVVAGKRCNKTSGPMATAVVVPEALSFLLPVLGRSAGLWVPNRALLVSVTDSVWMTT